MKHRIMSLWGSRYLLDGFVDSPKCWLLVIMVHSPVSMENEDTFLLSLMTVAAIHAVVWAIVPLTGKHIQALCNTERGMERVIINKWPGPRKKLKCFQKSSSCLKILLCARLQKPGLWWKMMLRRSWSPQVMLSLYFWRRGIRISSHFSTAVVMSFWEKKRKFI